MKKVVVLSGKGGTGKTTVVASLARLAGRVVAVECDVDAANLAILLPGEDGPRRPFASGERAGIDPARCTACGLCEEVCRYEAVHAGPDGAFAVDPLACEGCRACRVVCPTDAVTMRPNEAGWWAVRPLAEGWLVHAALGVAQDNSGKLVARVRQEAERLAAAEGVDLVLADGPPGIGCPVHAALGGQDLVLAVTEPTPSGLRDLGRLLDTARHFGVPVAVVVNKWDLSPAGTAGVEAVCRERGLPVLGRIPFDRAVPELLAAGLAPLAPPASDETRRALEGLWPAARTLLGLPG